MRRISVSNQQFHFIDTQYGICEIFSTAFEEKVVHICRSSRTIKDGVNHIGNRRVHHTEHSCSKPWHFRIQPLDFELFAVSCRIKRIIDKLLSTVGRLHGVLFSPVGKYNCFDLELITNLKEIQDSRNVLLINLHLISNLKYFLWVILW